MLTSSFMIISAGRVAQIIASLVAVRLFTSMLPTGEVGNLYLINSLTAFFGFSLLNPVGMYMYRKLNRWVSEGTLLDRFALYNAYVAAVALLSVPVLALLNRGFAVGSGINLAHLALYVALYLYVNTWNGTIIATFNLLEHRVSFVGYTVASTLMGLGLSVLLVIWSRTAIWWLAGQALAQVMVTIIALVHLRRLLGQSVSVRRLREELLWDNFHHVMTFVAPLSATTLLVWAQSQSYRLIIENCLGLEFLAKIGLGLSIASNIAAAVESVVQQTYMPIFYRKVSAGDTQTRSAACNRMFQLIIPVYLSMTLFIACLAPFLVTLLAHGKFGGAFLFVIYGAWIELFRMITGILSSAAHAEMKTRYLVRSYLTGAAIAVAGVYLGTFSGHFEHVIPTVLVVSGFLSMVVIYRDTKKIIPVKVGIRDIRKSAIMSLPFLAALPLYSLKTSIMASFVVTLIMGVYFLGSQYYFHRKRMLTACPV